MSDVPSLVALITGFALRLAIPILLTALVVALLRRMDARWQTEAEKYPTAAQVEKPACWEIKNCSPEQRKECLGYTSALPCWQARRTSNGYMREECLGCKIFLKAPTPSVG